VITPERKKEIISIFQRSLKGVDNSVEMQAIGLEEMRDVDAILGSSDSDAGYRIRIRQRIADLELLEQRNHDSKIRAWYIFVTLVVGIVIGYIVNQLT